jgi:hypothetical protein
MRFRRQCLTLLQPHVRTDVPCACQFKEEDLFTKSRKVVALGLATVIATAGVAVAGDTGADLNDAAVVSKVTPSKLPKNKFKPINVLLGVENSTDSTGNEDANAASERIAWSKNIKINLSKAPKCNVTLPPAIPTAQAKSMCPAKSVLGSGTAEVWAPDNQMGNVCDTSPAQDPPCKAADQVVTVFNGGGPSTPSGSIQLHTYGDLGPLSPTVPARIVTANQQEKRQGFGQALSVPNAPVTGALKIINFNSKIKKSSKVASAKCKPKKFKVKRTVTYTDGSSESASKNQNCTVKR